jgi:ParB family chromosome partitioning protein
MIEILPTQSLKPWTGQPRHQFVESSLREMAESIRQNGVVNPLLVRPHGEGWQIITGERRWRAAVMAGLEAVPVIVRELDDANALILALVENLQREDLNVMDRARGLRRLHDQLGSWDAVAKTLGFGVEAVDGMMKPLSERRMYQIQALNDLPEPVQDALSKGEINEKHGRALGRVKDPVEQDALFQQIQQYQFSGPETERLLQLIQQDEEETPFLEKLDRGVARLRGRPGRVMRSLQERIDDGAADLTRLLRQSAKDGTQVEGTLAETVHQLELAIRSWQRSKRLK